MPRGDDNVRSPIKTGRERKALKTALVTHFRHGSLAQYRQIIVCRGGAKLRETQGPSLLAATVAYTAPAPRRAARTRQAAMPIGSPAPADNARQQAAPRTLPPRAMRTQARKPGRAGTCASRRGPLLGIDRAWSAERQSDASDPTRPNWLSGERCL